MVYEQADDVEIEIDHISELYENRRDYEIDIELEPEREDDDIERAILNDEINPFMSEEDVENQKGYIFIYYYYNGRRDPELQFNIPYNWSELATTFTLLKSPVLWETQFIGELNNRDLVENEIRQRLEEYKNRGDISEYKMRRNYVRGYY